MKPLIYCNKTRYAGRTEVLQSSNLIRSNYYYALSNFRLSNLFIDASTMTAGQRRCFKQAVVSCSWLMVHFKHSEVGYVGRVQPSQVTDLTCNS